MQKKTIIFILLSLATCIILMFSVLFFIDYNKIAKNFLDQHNITTIGNLENIKLRFSPYPYFSISKLVTSDLEIQEAKFFLSIISLLSFNPKINYVDIVSAKLYSKNYHLTIQEHNKLIEGLLYYIKNNINLNINNTIIFNTQDNSLTTINNLILHINKDSISILRGKILGVGDLDVNITQNKGLIDLSLIFDNPIYKLKIHEQYQESKFIKGIIDCDIKSITNFISLYLPDLRSKLSNMLQQEYINIKSDIVLEDNILTLTNVNFNNKSVIGSGMIKLASENEVESVISLNFDKIDLHSLLKYNNDDSYNNTSKVVTEINKLKEYYENQKRLILDDNKLSLNVSIKEFNLINNYSINNLKIIAELNNNILNVNDISGKIQSDGYFIFKGIVDQNDIRSKFTGEMLISHNNINTILAMLGLNNMGVDTIIPFAMKSNIRATPVDILFKDIVLKSGNLHLFGDIATKLTSTVPRIKALLEITNIDIDNQKYPIITPALNFLINLTNDMYSNDYLTKFVPIRSIAYVGDIDIIFNNIKVKNTDINSINLVSSINQSQINISSLYINNGKDFMNLSADLITDDITPVLNLKIMDASLSIDDMNSALIIELRDTLFNKYDLKKVELTLDFNISKIYKKDFTLDNTKLLANNKGVLFNITDFSTNILSSKLEAKGSILLEPYTWNLVYAMNNIDLSKLGYKGLASFNGMVTTNGNNLERLFYNLYSKSSFIGKNLEVNNFSIDNFIDKIRTSNYDLGNIKQDINDALYTGTTNINDISGDIELDKGNIVLKNVLLQTKNTSASLSAIVNLYNLTTQITSDFAFNLPTLNNEVVYYNANTKSPNQTHLEIKANGNLSQLEKTTDLVNIIKLLSTKNFQNPLNNKQISN